MSVEDSHPEQLYKVGDNVEYYDHDEETGVTKWVPAHIYDIETKPLSERFVEFVLFGLPRLALELK